MGSIFSTVPSENPIISNFTEYKFSTTGSLPKRIDLRRTTCFPYLPPKDQGSEGSCVSHAMSAAVECAQRRHNISALSAWSPKIDQHFQMARNAIPEKKRRPEHEGITFTEAANAFKNDGIKTFRLKPTLENFKRCLNSGYPFVFGFTVTKPMRRWQDSQEQQKQTDYVLPDYNVNHAVDGFHSALAVGYDDCHRGGVFIIRNSWGPTWGHDGHFLIKYDTMSDLRVVRDAMVVDIVNKNG